MTDDPFDDGTVGRAYAELRIRVVDILRTSAPEEAAAPVRACPEWTVAQLASHLVGVPEDIIIGNLDGVTSDAWTDAQVRRHSGTDLRGLADSYEATGAVFDDVLASIPWPVSGQIVMDSTTHELDLLEALGRADHGETSAVQVSIAWLRHVFESRLDPSVFGAFDSGTIPSVTFLRCLTGRVAPERMRASGLDAESIVEALAGSPLRPPAD